MFCFFEFAHGFKIYSVFLINNPSKLFNMVDTAVVSSILKSRKFSVSKMNIDIPVKTRPRRSLYLHHSKFARKPKPVTHREFCAMKKLISENRLFPYIFRFIRFSEGAKFLVDFRDSRCGEGGIDLFAKPPLARFWGRRVWIGGKLGRQYHIFRLRKEIHSIQTRTEAQRQFKIIFQNWLFTQRALVIARKNDRAVQEDFKKLARGEDPGGWGAPRHRWERAMYHIVHVPLTLAWKINKIYWNCYWAKRKKRVHKGTTLAYFLISLFLRKKGREIWLLFYTQALKFLVRYGHHLPPPLPTNAELLRYVVDGELSTAVRHRYLYGKGNIVNRIRGQTFYPQPPSLIELLRSGYPIRFLLSLSIPTLFLYLSFQGFLLGNSFLCFSSLLPILYPQLLGLNQLRSWADFLLVFLEVQLRHLLSLPRRALKHFKWKLRSRLGWYLDERKQPELYRWWRRKLKKFETPEDYAYRGQPPNHRFKIENEPWELRFILGEWAELSSPLRKPRSPTLLLHLHPPLTLPLLFSLSILLLAPFILHPTLLYHALYLLFLFKVKLSYYGFYVAVLVMTIGPKRPF